MCLFAILVAFAPRVALAITWLFTPLVDRAFGTFLVPLLGLLFLPFTTLVYVFAYVPGVGLSGWGWLWVVIALMLDAGTYGGGAVGRRRQTTTVIYQ